MKILIMAGAGGSGGLRQYLKGFISAAASESESGLEVFVLCSEKVAQIITESDTPNVRIITSEKSVTKLSDCLFNRKYPDEITETVRQLEPDVIYFPNSIIRRGFERYRKVLEVHNQLYFRPDLIVRHGISKTTASLLIQRRAALKSIKKAELVVFDSESSKAGCISSGIIPKESVVAHFGVEKCPDIRRRKNSEKDSIKKLIYISAFYPYKNHKELLKGLAVLKSRKVDFVISFVGTGPEKYVSGIKRTVKKLGLCENVKFTGQVPHGKTAELIDEADVFVYASETETSGLGLMEGMARGAVIASNNSSCLPEILGDGGLLFNVKDPYKTADALYRLCTNEELCKTLSVKAVMKSKEYTWENHNCIIFDKMKSIFS